MMKLNLLTPLLYTKDLQAAIDFYTKVFGFTCTAHVPAYGFARVQLEGADIMFALPNAHIPFEKPVLTGSLYINTTDADGWWQKLKDKCKVCYEIETFPYGMREFAVYDNNGYLIQFGQNMQ
jgi:uncharacterized glyoxalase superfamily protein PhnB